MKSLRRVIEIRECRFGYPAEKHTLIDIPALDITASEHVFVYGRSGSGKSTFLNLLCGVLAPDRGEINILGTRFDTLSAVEKDRFRADHFGVIFQQFNLLPHLSAQRNIELACDFSVRKKHACPEAAAVAAELIARLDLPPSVRDTPAMHLSIGQQQRIAAARALIGRPEIILADEPTSALDAEARRDFMRLLFEQADAQGTTVVFVSHDTALAEHFDRHIDFERLCKGGA